MEPPLPGKLRLSTGGGILEMAGPDTGQVVDHVYTNPGTYGVALVVTDERGGNDTETKSISIAAYVEPTPPPTQPAQPTATSCTNPGAAAYSYRGTNPGSPANSNSCTDTTTTAYANRGTYPTTGDPSTSRDPGSQPGIRGRTNLVRCLCIGCRQ